MSQSHRLMNGGRVDRSKQIDFYFNGRLMSGYEGDTLASALLANGVMLVGRSFKYHRPRGIVSAGTEEPNALVQLERGARTISNMLATRIPLYDGLDAAPRMALALQRHCEGCDAVPCEALALPRRCAWATRLAVCEPKSSLRCATGLCVHGR